MCPCKHHYKRSEPCTCPCSHGRVTVIEDEAVANVVGPNCAGIFIPDGAFDAPEPEDTDDVEPEPLKEGDAVRALAQAIIWTREYVGEATLPAVKGWSWYDALREHAPEFLPEKPAQCTALYEYEEGKYVRCGRAAGHANPDHQGYGKGWLAGSAWLAESGGAS